MNTNRYLSGDTSMQIKPDRPIGNAATVKIRPATELTAERIEKQRMVAENLYHRVYREVGEAIQKAHAADQNSVILPLAIPEKLAIELRKDLKYEVTVVNGSGRAEDSTRIKWD